MTPVRSAGAALVAAALFGAPAGAAGDTAPLTVLAASSLRESFPRIDGEPRYSFAGTNRLAFQLRRGAPADVFASASPAYTQSLFRAGLLERPRTLAFNRLVLAVPRSNPAGLRSVYDLRTKDVKLVIGTAQVPVGTYTRKVLHRLGLGSALDAVVSAEPDVKSIVGKLALGQGDAGFVYATDVRAAAGRLRAIPLPARGRPKVRYEVAVVVRTTHRTAARRWVRTVTTAPRARTVLRRAGFLLR
jgi:molybdate transport system substrate-binding protein